MNELRKAAQQALEALEMEATSPPIPETAAAIEALRAALAQPEPPQRNTLPLSDDEIKCIKPICADFVSFRAGVRHAEREHGIGGEE